MAKIILFDGDCNFCNHAVNFIIKRDLLGKFQFSSQQSPFGRKLKKEYDIPVEEDSLILIEKNKSYTKSTAALRISKSLDGLWKLLYVFIIVPRPIRNWVYMAFAKNRYKWFGKRMSCQIHPPHVQKRFLT